MDNILVSVPKFESYILTVSSEVYLALLSLKQMLV
jgi:hypothetical protein